jgi:O-antigen ligase
VALIRAMDQPLVLRPPSAIRADMLMRALDRAGAVCVLLLPPALLHARGVADIFISVTAFLFLVRSVLTGEWAWTRQAWVRVALGLWAWLVLCSAHDGRGPAVLQALASLRMFLFAAALQAWVLREEATRRRLWWVVAAMAAWIVLESWQQMLLGRNLMGYPRWGDGALTGPFQKPHAGHAYLETMFIALLPVAVPLLDRPRLLPRLGGVVLLIFAAATMVLIGQRMPTLLMVLDLLAAALLLPRLRTPVLVALALGAALLAATPIVSPPTYAKLVVKFSQQMSHFLQSDYGLLYVRAMFMTETHPWFGLGFDGFRAYCADPAYFHGVAWLGISDGQSGGLDGCNIHPHNYFLEFATTSGLPGLALFAALAVLWLARLFPRQPDPLRVALFATALTALWPLAATNAFFVADTAGWTFLTIGWGLAMAYSGRAG